MTLTILAILSSLFIFVCSLYGFYKSGRIKDKTLLFISFLLFFLFIINAGFWYVHFRSQKDWEQNFRITETPMSSGLNQRSPVGANETIIEEHSFKLKVK